MSPLQDPFSQRRMIIAVFITTLISTMCLWNKNIPREYKKDVETERPLQNQLETLTNNTIQYAPRTQSSCPNSTNHYSN